MWEDATCTEGDGCSVAKKLVWMYSYICIMGIWIFLVACFYLLFKKMLSGMPSGAKSAKSAYLVPRYDLSKTGSSISLFFAPCAGNMGGIQLLCSYNRILLWAHVMEVAFQKTNLVLHFWSFIYWLDLPIFFELNGWPWRKPRRKPYYPVEIITIIS